MSRRSRAHIMHASKLYPYSCLSSSLPSMLGAEGAASSNGKDKKDKKAKGKVKDEDDPDLIRAVKQIVSELDIQGGSRKAQYTDMLAVQLAFIPINLSKWIFFQADWYYKHNVQGLPLSAAEEEYLAEKVLGKYRWENMTAEDKAELVGMKIWEDGEFSYQIWYEKKQMANMKPNELKKYLRQRKRSNKEEADGEYDDE